MARQGNRIVHDYLCARAHFRPVWSMLEEVLDERRNVLRRVSWRWRSARGLVEVGRMTGCWGRFCSRAGWFGRLGSRTGGLATSAVELGGLVASGVELVGLATSAGDGDKEPVGATGLLATG